MRFARTDEQRAFARSLDDLLGAADVPAAARAWARGEHTEGLALWGRLAELGVHALRLPERHGGLGAGPVETTVAFEALGRHAVPGPYLETVVVAPALLADVEAPGAPSWAKLGEGAELVTLAAPPHLPFALDAEVAQRIWVWEGEQLHEGVVGAPRRSVDATRRLSEVTPTGSALTLHPAAVAAAFDEAALGCAATLLGAGRRLLADTVEYAGMRQQFGRPIGEYQALKHALADVRVALDFAEPLVHGAALSLAEGSSDGPRDVSAAKVAAGDAAYRASRTGLQVHGAIGYTLEHDLSLWLTKVRALVGTWGTPSFHRARVMEAVA